MLTTDHSGQDEVWFISSFSEVESSGVTLHRRGESPAAAVARRFEEVQQDWQSMITRVMELARSTDEAVPEARIQLTELEIELGFTAAGKLAFIAEAGVAGSITLTFTRTPRGSATRTGPVANHPSRDP
jgi:hypothetical protein